MSRPLHRKINLAHKTEPPAPAEKAKTVYYPTLYISDHKLPLTFDDAGKSFTVQATLKLTGITQRTKEKATYDFEIHDISFIKA